MIGGKEGRRLSDLIVVVVVALRKSASRWICDERMILDCVLLGLRGSVSFSLL